MKRSKLLPILFISLFVFGCKRDKTDNLSTSSVKVSWWSMGKDTFRTMHTDKYVNGRVFSMSYRNLTNDTAFYIQIDTTNENLTNDSFGNYGDYHGDSKIHDFYNNHSGSYTLADNDTGTYVYSVRENGKIKITLEPALYYRWNSNNTQRPEDSAIIQGVFYEQ